MMRCRVTWLGCRVLSVPAGGRKLSGCRHVEHDHEPFSDPDSPVVAAHDRGIWVGGLRLLRSERDTV